MAKLIYETTLLVCSSCVIFTGTVSAVLLMLVWPQDRILGLSTRLVIGLCIIIVAIFSVGFVGTIAESTNALIIYACLLILFPVSVLLVEIILRLSSLSPIPAVPPAAINHNGGNTTSTSATISPPPPSPSSSSSSSSSSPSPPPSSSSSSSSASTYSNSFTSNSFSLSSSSSTLNHLNLTKNSISFASESNEPSPPLDALILPPSIVPPLSHNNKQNRFNLSNDMLLLSDPKFVAATSQSVLPTEFYRPIRDEYHHQPSSSAKHLSNYENEIRVQQKNLPPNNGLNLSKTKESRNNIEFNKSLRPTTTTTTTITTNNDKENFLSKIFTASLNPRVETSIEYILIGMLAFVLLQIVISYLLAYEIRTLRSQLKILSFQSQSNLNDDGSQREDESEVANLPRNTETSLFQLDPAESVCLTIGETTNFPDMDSFNIISVNEVYNCYCNHPSQQQHCHFLEPASTTISNDSNIVRDNVCTINNNLDHKRSSLIQVHVNPDESSHIIDNSNNHYINICDKHNHSSENYQPINNVNNNTDSETIISSPHSSLITDKTNRRNRSGSFRVTFEKLPEFFETNNHNSSSAKT